MGYDTLLAYKASMSNPTDRDYVGYQIAHRLQLEQIETNKIMANEYYDFIGFLLDELGDEYKELRRKFEIENFGEAVTYDEDLELIENYKTKDNE